MTNHYALVSRLFAAYTKAVCQNPKSTIHANIEAAVESIPLYNAAPDLLEVLQRILRAHDSKNNGAYMGEAVLCHMFAEQARAAIAKATGN